MGTRSTKTHIMRLTLFIRLLHYEITAIHDRLEIEPPMNTPYIQLTLFDLESYSANPQQKPLNLPSQRTASIKVYLTVAEKAQLEEYVSSQGKTMSDTVRQAIQFWIQGHSSNP
jgi:hypothetical protein